MAEWWSVVAVFWALYLADGVVGGRRARLFLSAWRGGPPQLPGWKSKPPRRPCHACLAKTAALTEASWHFTAPWPWAWSVPLADVPAAFSRAGLVNRPAASTARPPAWPEVLRAERWEKTGKIATGGGWISLGGKRFTPLTEALDAGELQRMVARLARLLPEQRAEWLRAWWRSRLSPLRARRRLAGALLRTRPLAFLNTLQTAGWGVLTLGLLGEWFVPGADATGRAVSWSRYHAPSQEPWWALLIWLVLMHFWSVAKAWRAHRKLYPSRKEERGGMVFSALLLPPQALRFRALLLRPLGKEITPLAAVLAAGAPAVARSAAAATLRDVAYPARSANLPEFFARQAEEAAKLVRPELERVLQAEARAGKRELAPSSLLAAPADFPPEVCAWCPRCGDGFVRSDGACPHGIKLQPR